MREGICTMLLLHSDDEDNVYVGVDKEVVYGPGDDDDVVHDEGGLDNVERLHHCRKVEVKVEGAPSPSRFSF